MVSVTRKVLPYMGAHHFQALMRNSVPFFIKNNGIKFIEKGTNLKKYFKNAHEPPSGGP